jgi:hypothetical protein
MGFGIPDPGVKKAPDPGSATLPDLKCFPVVHGKGFDLYCFVCKVGRLEMVGGTAAYSLHVGENRIGRDSATCHIVLSQPSISRTHAIVEVSG